MLASAARVELWTATAWSPQTIRRFTRRARGYQQQRGRVATCTRISVAARYTSAVAVASALPVGHKRWQKMGLSLHVSFLPVRGG